MPLHCGILKCKSNAKRVKKSFYRLPSVLSRASCFVKRLSVLRRKRWLLAIKRSDITESKAKYMRVCEDHFVTGKPAAMEDTNHPDWVPSIRLGYGNTSDRKYIRCLRRRVLKHTKTSLLQLQTLVAESSNVDADKIDVNIPDSIYDMKGYLFKNNIDTDSDTRSDRQGEDSIDDDQNAVDTDGVANGSQRNDSIVNVPDHQYTLLTYSEINDSQGQECSNNKAHSDNVYEEGPSDNVDDKVPSVNVGNKVPFVNVNNKVPSDKVNDKVPSVNVNNKVPSDNINELDDCNLSPSFLNNLTKLQQSLSVSVHVQTDLKTTDLDYLNQYCEDTRKKLAEANKKIKLLNLLLNSKSAQNSI